MSRFRWVLLGVFLGLTFLPVAQAEEIRWTDVSRLQSTGVTPPLEARYYRVIKLGKSQFYFEYASLTPDGKLAVLNPVEDSTFAEKVEKTRADEPRVASSTQRENASANNKPQVIRPSTQQPMPVDRSTQWGITVRPRRDDVGTGNGGLGGFRTPQAEPAVPKVKWSDASSYNDALKEYDEKKKGIVLYIMRDQCQACEKLGRAFDNKEVAPHIDYAKYNFIKINTDRRSNDEIVSSLRSWLKTDVGVLDTEHVQAPSVVIIDGYATRFEPGYVDARNLALMLQNKQLVARESGAPARLEGGGISGISAAESFETK